MLNKSTGNMFDLVGCTWNPQKGCRHGCIYCYATKMRFPYDMTPGFREHFMNDDLYEKGEGIIVFVSDMGDLFGSWVPSANVDRILDKCLAFPKNKYLLCTKNADGLLPFFANYNYFSDGTNFILGTTIETDAPGLWYTQFSKAPPPTARVYPMMVLHELGFQILVSIEPVLEFNLIGLLGMVSAISPLIVAVGADSKKCGLPEPDPEKVVDLVAGLKEFVPHIVIKPNLLRLLGRQRYHLCKILETRNLKQELIQDVS